MSQAVPGVRVDLFSKTKLCKFNQIGACKRGSACMFAHSADELNAAPDLFCTKMCKTFINTGSCRNNECKYAHTEDELRISSIGTRPKEDAQNWRKQKAQKMMSQGQVCASGSPSQVPPVSSTATLLAPGKVRGGPLSPGALSAPADVFPLVLPETPLLVQVPTPPHASRRRQDRARQQQLQQQRQQQLPEDDPRLVFGKMNSCPLPRTNSGSEEELCKLRGRNLMVVQEQSARESFDDRLAKWNEVFHSTPITVKNTFLEFETNKVGQLKSVRSCDGRINAMACQLLED
eukprot:TRINITY_DN5133_c0_g1_i1.p1 TRINITY_DN5133_c0_g1~~TRINITY_DN5133_c0_g1_i1.p1  ORF type:complete len:327 (+),score=55.55 TRINITY_DN5133_c0_g1_i1:112-981(+)